MQTGQPKGKFFHKLSIKGKLLALTMLISMSSIFVTSLVFSVQNIYLADRENRRNANLILQIMSDKIASAVFFENEDLVKTELKTFEELPVVESARVLTKNSALISDYKREKEPASFLVKWWFITSFSLEKKIYEGTDVIGILEVVYDNRELSHQLWSILFYFLGILSLGILIAYELMRYTHHFFTDPLFMLVDFSKKVSAGQRDIRLHLSDQKEFLLMANAINSMLDNLEANEKKLKEEVQRAEEAKASLERQNIIRSEAEWELQKVQGHLNDIINSMPSALVGVDKTKRIIEWNQAAANFFNIPIVTALGKSLIQLVPTLKEYLGGLDIALETREVQTSGRFFYPEKGRERYLDILVYPLSIDSGGGAVIRVDDVTTRVKIDTMLQQSQKMMSVSGLAAGMAHEINNPLGGIIQSAQNIERRIQPGLPANEEVAKELGLQLENVYRYLEMRGILKFVKGVRDLGERAASIVHNMLQFSRPTDHKMVKASITELVGRAIHLAESDYDLKKNWDFLKIVIEKEYPEAPIEAFCFPSELEQALLNIFRNAAQAMMGGTPRIEHPVIHIKISSNIKEVIIEIKDNGSGMTEEVKNKCFEPFFTTREVGQGTGLGLSVAFFIVSVKHNGHLTVESSPGNGANFMIRFPL